jgi:hypothetical protein
MLVCFGNAVEVCMDEFKRVEKRTEVRETPQGDVTNINVPPDNATAVDEETTVDEERETKRHEIVDDPLGSKIIQQEETIEKHQR